MEPRKIYSVHKVFHGLTPMEYMEDPSLGDREATVETVEWDITLIREARVSMLEPTVYHSEWATVVYDRDIGPKAVTFKFDHSNKYQIDRFVRFLHREEIDLCNILSWREARMHLELENRMVSMIRSSKKYEIENIVPMYLDELIIANPYARSKIAFSNIIIWWSNTELHRIDPLRWLTHQAYKESTVLFGNEDLFSDNVEMQLCYTADVMDSSVNDPV